VVSLAGRLQVKRIQVSPVLRARQTGDLLAALTGAPVELEDDLASGVLTGGQLLRLAEELGPGTALIGHNPELAEAIALVTGHALDVPPGTVAAIEPGRRLAWVARPGGT